MSFKREGNDTNLLQKLRKRRITELLSEDVPQDEAKLLCNGRFACIVCPSNPIFDTVSVLTVHRNGKKHLSNLEIHESKKRELNRLIAARKHQQYTQDGTTSIQMANSTERGLLTSCPYDPRVKKTKVKKGERKPILDFDSKGGTSTRQSVDTHDKTVSTSAKNVNSVKYNSSAMRAIFDQSLSGPVKHGHQLKNIFQEKLEEPPVRLSPYKSKFRKCQSVSHVTGGSSQPGSQNHTLNDGKFRMPQRTSHVTGAPSQQDSQNHTFNGGKFRMHVKASHVTGSSSQPGSQNLTLKDGKFRMPQRASHVTRGPSQQCSHNHTLNDGLGVYPSSYGSINSASSEIISSKTTLNPNLTSIPVSSQMSSPWQHGLSSSKQFAVDPGIQSHKLLLAAAVPPPPPPPPKSPPLPSIENCTESIKSASTISEKLITNTEIDRIQGQKQIVQQLKQLQGSGWKRDWDGKWIKDENAEFDSDEESPDIP